MFSVLILPGAAACATIDVQTIIQKSVVANQVDFKAAPEYSFRKRERDDQSSKTYDVDMIDGSPYQLLLAVNDKPLSKEESAKEQQKLAQAKNQRRAESKERRQRRIAKYEKDRNRDHAMMQQLTKAFQFKLLGQSKLRSFNVYMLRATPRPGYKPPNMETQVLSGMRGELWIDSATYQWVKVTAKVIRPVSIEGFLARVEPGTRFELQKMPVGDGIWLPKHFAMKSQAKILRLFSRSSQEDDTFSNYHKAAY
jgi:hypothetical protein